MISIPDTSVPLNMNWELKIIIIKANASDIGLPTAADKAMVIEKKMYQKWNQIMCIVYLVFCVLCRRRVSREAFTMGILLDLCVVPKRLAT